MYGTGEIREKKAFSHIYFQMFHTQNAHEPEEKE
jgi:hypothetical protein